METYTLARIIHILSVIVWIGGVSMVTTVVIPTLRNIDSKEERFKVFKRVEKRFQFQAKIATTLTMLSGLYMLYYLDAWGRFADASYWWIYAMIIVWFIFSMILFVIEPYVVHKRFKQMVEKYPDKTFKVMQRMHWILLIISIITIIGSVAGSHGWFFF
jgi:uncharacterized membrane protein